MILCQAFNSKSFQGKILICGRYNYIHTYTIDNGSQMTSGYVLVNLIAIFFFLTV